MPRYAIGDIQGCFAPLRELLTRLHFSADRDQLYLVGDLVNRGPASLEVLRFVRSLGDSAKTVLGNHDLHLLAVHHDPDRELKSGDTLEPLLAAPDREALLDWLIAQPLILEDEHGDVLLHAGLVPEWTIAEALQHGSSASDALRANPRQFLRQMYGNKPDRWRDARTATERHRVTVNVLTRLRYCRADGRMDLRMKDAPGKASGEWLPWFDHAARRSADHRIVFGHWSTLGLLRRRNLLALDTGCVWGGALTAVNLDEPAAPPVHVACAACE